MTITLNGQPVEIALPCSVEDLLRRRGLADKPCAVEVNRNLVPKARHAGHALAEGDTVEIVTLVGGG